MLTVLFVTYRRIRDKHNIPHVREVLRKHVDTLPYIKQGLWIALDKNAGNLFPKVFLFIMSLFAPATAVGIAQLAYKIGALPTSLLIPHVVRIATTVLPAIRNRGAFALRKHCALLIKHALAYHSIVSFVSLFILPWLVIIFYGPEYSGVIEPMLWIVIIMLVTALNVVNAPLFRLERKTHIPALWAFATMPFEIIIFILLLKWQDPLSAFVLIVLIRYILNLWLNWYVFTVLLSKDRISSA